MTNMWHTILWVTIIRVTTKFHCNTRTTLFMYFTTVVYRLVAARQRRSSDGVGWSRYGHRCDPTGCLADSGSTRCAAVQHRPRGRRHTVWTRPTRLSHTFINSLIFTSTYLYFTPFQTCFLLCFSVRLFHHRKIRNRKPLSYTFSTNLRS